MAPKGSERARTGDTLGKTMGAATAVGDAPGEPPGVPKPQDWRYPRPGWFRALRWILRLWWLAFALFAGNALFNLVTVAADQGVSALADATTVAQALRSPS